MILRALKEMDNKQLYDFTREQTQVFLTARLGDGCIYHTKSNSWIYTTNCKHIEYLEFKKSLIGNIRFNPKLVIAEDYQFNKKVKKGKKANITEVLYYYEQFSPDSLIKSGRKINDKYKKGGM